MKLKLYAASLCTFLLLLSAAFSQTRPTPPKAIDDDGKIKTYCGVFFGEENPLEIDQIKRRAISAIREKGWTLPVKPTCLVQISLYSESACTVSINGPNNQSQIVTFNKKGEITRVESQPEGN
jgi:hypothetical protein